MPAKTNERSTRFSDEQLQRLDDEHERLDRPVSWVIRRAVDLYFALSEDER